MFCFVFVFKFWGELFFSRNREKSRLSHFFFTMPSPDRSRPDWKDEKKAVALFLDSCRGNPHNRLFKRYFLINFILQLPSPSPRCLKSRPWKTTKIKVLFLFLFLFFLFLFFFAYCSAPKNKTKKVGMKFSSALQHNNDHILPLIEEDEEEIEYEDIEEEFEEDDDVLC